MSGREHGPRTVLAIGGMTCAGCANSISRVLQMVPGVERAEVDVNGGRAIIEGRATVELLVQAVEEAGYEAHAVEPGLHLA